MSCNRHFALDVNCNDCCPDTCEYGVCIRPAAGEDGRHCAQHRGGVRTFATGATRDLDQEKLDYEGFLSPAVLERFAQYMHKHRQTAAGLRDSDNWQKGIPVPVYVKSLFRHFMTVWRAHRFGEDIPEEELCAILFNVQGLLFERLRATDQPETGADR